MWTPDGMTGTFLPTINHRLHIHHHFDITNSAFSLSATDEFVPLIRQSPEQSSTSSQQVTSHPAIETTHEAAA